MLMRAAAPLRHLLEDVDALPWGLSNEPISRVYQARVRRALDVLSAPLTDAELAQLTR
jgi:hypothetical protein